MYRIQEFRLLIQNPSHFTEGETDASRTVMTEDAKASEMRPKIVLFKLGVNTY